MAAAVPAPADSSARRSARRHATSRTSASVSEPMKRPSSALPGHPGHQRMPIRTGLVTPCSLLNPMPVVGRVRARQRYRLIHPRLEALRCRTTTRAAYDHGGKRRSSASLCPSSFRCSEVRLWYRRCELSRLRPRGASEVPPMNRPAAVPVPVDLPLLGRHAVGGERLPARAHRLRDYRAAHPLPPPGAGLRRRPTCSCISQEADPSGSGRPGCLRGARDGEAPAHVVQAVGGARGAGLRARSHLAQHSGGGPGTQA